jgi:hypothetical protein
VYVKTFELTAINSSENIEIKDPVTVTFVMLSLTLLLTTHHCLRCWPQADNLEA